MLGMISYEYLHCWSSRITKILLDAQHLNACHWDIYQLYWNVQLRECSLSLCTTIIILWGAWFCLIGKNQERFHKNSRPDMQLKCHLRIHVSHGTPTAWYFHLLLIIFWEMSDTSSSEFQLAEVTNDIAFYILYMQQKHSTHAWSTLK